MWDVVPTSTVWRHSIRCKSTNSAWWDLGFKGCAQRSGLWDTSSLGPQGPVTPRYTTQRSALRIFRLRRQGKSLREIGKQLGCLHAGIDGAIKEQRSGPRPVT